MSNNELNKLVSEYRELRRMADELNNEMEAIKDSIKAEMTTEGKDVLTGTDWKASWTSVSSNRVDTTALKKELPDIAARYTKTSTSRRFTLI